MARYSPTSATASTKKIRKSGKPARELATGLRPHRLIVVQPFKDTWLILRWLECDRDTEGGTGRNDEPAADMLVGDLRRIKPSRLPLDVLDPNGESDEGRLIELG